MYLLASNQYRNRSYSKNFFYGLQSLEIIGENLPKILLKQQDFVDLSKIIFGAIIGANFLPELGVQENNGLRAEVFKPSFPPCLSPFLF
jgi:hypothetical protein